MSFSPGPWFTMDGTVVSTESGTVCHMEKSNPDRRANARLIAAAPDLLDIVLGIAARHANDNGDEYLEMLDVIAKALNP